MDFMRTTVSRSCLTFLLLLGACLHMPLERSIERQSWFEAQAGPFRIVSNLGRDQVLALADRLLVFEQLARRLTNARDVKPRVPTLVLALSGGAYGQFDPPVYTTGLFVPTIRGNYVLLDARVRGGVAPENVLYHEYGHFLLHNGSALSYPAWYDEGTAELLRSTHIGQDSVTFGEPLTDRIRTLVAYGFMSSERLFTARSTFELPAITQEIFYAQAWLTTLYLEYANNRAAQAGLVDRKAQVLQYLMLYNQGVPSSEAFTQAFGTTFEKFDRELQSFARSKVSIPIQGISRDKLGVIDPPALRVLRPAEVAEELADAALAIGARADTRAERLFARAAELEPDASRAAFGLARTRLRQANGEGLDALYERAHALGPDDLLGQLDYAEYVIAKASSSGKDQEGRELAAQAVALLEQIVVRAPECPEAFYNLAQAYDALGDDPERVQTTLEAAYALLPSDLGVAYALAKRLGASGRFNEARRIATRALAGSHDPESAAALQALLTSWPPASPAAVP
jgi:tetratricopeptide (TPR) repeat protein